MGKTWKYNPDLVRKEGHSYVFDGIEEYSWGIQTKWHCGNPGCNLMVAIPVKPKESVFQGICFDSSLAIEIKEE